MSSVEDRARNRLADAYDLRGWKDEANALRSGMPMDSPTVAALDTIAAALREQPEAREGWKLVPVEATDEMLTAYHAADKSRAPGRSGYAAMLAAAPTPPGDDAAGGAK